MPLNRSGSKDSVSQNIHQLRSENYPQPQAVAIAMDIRRKANNYARGGGIPGQYGFVHGDTPGRADTRPTGVKGGSYVIPADIVSSLGQGNSMAGANALNRMFKMGVPNVTMPKAQRTPTGPRKYADGGEIPIQVSDGEFLIPPEKVAEIGQGDIEFGHDILDKFVQQARAKSIQHLSSLPPPKGSEQSFNDGGDVDFDGAPYFAQTETPPEQLWGEYRDDRSAYGPEIADRSMNTRSALRQGIMQDNLAYVPPTPRANWVQRTIGVPLYGAIKRAGF